jgi:putative two-component system response regulator
MKPALSGLVSELKERLASGSSESHDLFVAAVRALARVRGRGNAELRLNCLFDCGNYFYVGGFPAAAVQTAQLALSLAQRSGLKEWVRKSETLLGIVSADAGNFADALIHYSRAIEIAKETGDRYGEAIVLQGLGVALNYAGLFSEAIPLFRRAAEIGAHMKLVESRAHTNIAQSYYFTEQFSRALVEIQHAIEKGGEPNDAGEALSRTIKEATYVQIAIALGMRRLAFERAELCRKHARWGGTPRSLLLADLSSAMCDVFFGDAASGIESLRSCADRAEHVPAVKPLALVALVKALEASGDAPGALVCLRELLAYIRTHRQRGVSQLILSCSPDGMPFDDSVFERNLESFEHRVSQLRAKVAERQLAAAQLEMLDRFAISADLREEASGEHGFRVGRLSSLLAESVGWSRDACSVVDVAARLHDIGKIGIPDRILLNSEELKTAERHLMCAHTLIGAEMLSKSALPQLKLAEEIARCHHEWWNGEGYPAKLRGERIPIHARIVALADVFDAMTHGRPYETAWPIDRALEQIRSLRGTQFDPELTDRFIALVERLRRDHDDLDEFLGRGARNSPFLQARRRIRELVSADLGTGTPVRGNETRH